MPLLVNLRHLATRDVALTGEIATAELDINTLDEMIRVREPLRYDLTVQKSAANLLVCGKLAITLDCQCVRCLRPVRQTVNLQGVLCDLPLAGDDAVPVVNDCVDLTPHLREDILLEFPQHPVCERDCPGRPTDSVRGVVAPDEVRRAEDQASAWAELNRLKF